MFKSLFKSKEEKKWEEAYKNVLNDQRIVRQLPKDDSRLIKSREIACPGKPTIVVYNNRNFEDVFLFEKDYYEKAINDAMNSLDSGAAKIVGIQFSPYDFTTIVDTEDELFEELDEELDLDEK